MDGNQSCCEWTKVRRARKNVAVLGTAGTAWRRYHTRDASGTLIHEKRCFSYFRRTGTARR